MNQNSSLHEKADAARRQVETVIRGKSAAVELLFTALFAGGHVLMDDVPGVGKTTLAKALAFTAFIGPPILSAHWCILRRMALFPSAGVRSSRSCCWRMKSTGRRRALSPPCWKP